MVSRPATREGPARRVFLCEILIFIADQSDPGHWRTVKVLPAIVIVPVREKNQGRADTE
jgi:hypothetical protein